MGEPWTMIQNSHVEVVNGCNQSHKRTYIQRGLPMVANIHGLHQEEDSGGHHGDGNDPERDGDGIVGVQEAMGACGSSQISAGRHLLKGAMLPAWCQEPGAKSL